MKSVRRACAIGRTLAIGLVSTVLLVAAAGCGGDDNGGGSGGGGSGGGGEGQSDLTGVKFKMGSFEAPTPLYWARDLGFFDDLSLETVPQTSAAAALPLIANGTLAGQSSAGAPAPATAVVRKIPIKIVWIDSVVTPELVTKGDVSSPSQLTGRLGVPGGSIDEVLTKTYIEENGIGDQIKVVDLPAENLAAAFKTGQIQAMTWSPPITTAARASGGKTLKEFAFKGVTLFGQRFIGEHPDVVQAYVCGLAKANERFVEGDRKDYYRAMAKDFDLKASLVAEQFPPDTILTAKQVVSQLEGGDVVDEITTLGRHLAEEGSLPASPERGEVAKVVDLTFARAAANGKCQ